MNGFRLASGLLLLPLLLNRLPEAELGMYYVFINLYALLPIIDFGFSVSIGRHVILGTQSVVFPGVSVAEGCATGAHTVINHSTEPWGIYVGSPARRIKSREKGLLALEAAYLAEDG